MSTLKSLTQKMLTNSINKLFPQVENARTDQEFDISDSILRAELKKVSEGLTGPQKATLMALTRKYEQADSTAALNESRKALTAFAATLQ